MKRLILLPLYAACAVVMAGCSAQPGTPEAADAAVPDAAEDQPFAGIAPTETVRFTGTEPFWGGQIVGDTLTWSTPENIEGEQIAVERFAGRGGLSFNGTLQGEALLLAVTPGQCSDGMSDATYPFVVTVDLGVRQLNGCGWTDSQPYTGME